MGSIVRRFLRGDLKDSHKYMSIIFRHNQLRKKKLDLQRKTSTVKKGNVNYRTLDISEFVETL